ncbi:hypothetical protein BVX95_00530, partial [archaeon D22]
LMIVLSISFAFAKNTSSPYKVKNNPKFDLEISSNDASINVKFTGTDKVHKFKKLKLKEKNNIKFSTPGVFIESDSFLSAEVVLQKIGPISAVYYCSDEVLASDCLTGWQKTDIPFFDNGTHIIFNVTHFSTYAGGSVDTSVSNHTLNQIINQSGTYVLDTYLASQSKTYSTELEFQGSFLNISVEGSGNQANITLLNDTATTYFKSGIYESSIISLSNNPSSLEIKSIQPYGYFNRTSVVECQGDNDYGEVVNYLTGDALSVSSNKETTCVLLSNGNVDCYGRNNYGQAEDYLGGDAVAVSVGGYHTCVLTSAGNVDCYGLSTNGRAPDYNGGDAVGVAAGNGHTCILKSNGNAYCYGFDEGGETADYLLGDAVAVSADWSSSCVLTKSGNVDCWGGNSYGETDDYTSGDAVAVAAGYHHTCILTSSGNVDCNGFNNVGQSNDYNGGDAIKVDVGAMHTCIVKKDGNVDCWGNNAFGESNDYTGGDATTISTGDQFSCILKGGINILEINGSTDGSTWSSAPVPSGIGEGFTKRAFPPSLRNSTYLKYRIFISTNDTSYTPHLENVTFEYDKTVHYSSGTFTSILISDSYNQTVLFDSITFNGTFGGEIIADNSTILLMHFNNDSEYGENDTLVYDFSGNGNNGTCANSTVCPTYNSSGGKIFGALEFDGVDDYIEVQDSSSLNFGTIDFSISFWAKSNRDDIASSFFAKRESGGSLIGYNFLQRTGVTAVPIATIDGGASNAQVQAKTAFGTGQWHHMVLTRDDGNLTIYRDGVDDTDSRVITNGLNVSFSVNLQIARNRDGVNNFNGSIDELTFYNKSLTASEVLEIYDRTKLGYKNLDVKYQIATNNDGSTWTFVGPDLTSDTFYYASGEPLNVPPSKFLKYKFFLSTGDFGATPIVSNISMKYNYPASNNISDSKVNVSTNTTQLRIWDNNEEGNKNIKTTFYANYTDFASGKTVAGGINAWDTFDMVMDIGTQGTYDTVTVNGPMVIRNQDGNYDMWYNGYNGSHYRILHAVSTNGMNWTNISVVVNLSSEGTYDVDGAWNPSVIKNNDSSYDMWYTGSASSVNRIIHAESSDGITWENFSMVIGDGVQPSVVKNDDGTYDIWYGRLVTSKWRTYHADSVDGLTWVNISLAIDVGSEGTNDGMLPSFTIVKFAIPPCWPRLNSFDWLTVGEKYQLPSLVTVK